MYIIPTTEEVEFLPTFGFAYEDAIANVLPLYEKRLGGKVVFSTDATISAQSSTPNTTPFGMVRARDDDNFRKTQVAFSPEQITVSYTMNGETITQGQAIYEIGRSGLALLEQDALADILWRVYGGTDRKGLSASKSIGQYGNTYMATITVSG